jgi:hypothetical protein
MGSSLEIAVHCPTRASTKPTIGKIGRKTPAPDAAQVTTSTIVMTANIAAW